MLVGVPKEIKDNEFRVGMTPATIAELTHHGHSVLVETSAGLGSGLTDDEYHAAGAAIVNGAAEIFARAEMIVKVKEPQANERRMMRSGQTLFTYLHLAPDRPQTEDLIASGAVCIAYETVTSSTGGLPLLAPMSEVAGRLAPQVGAHALEKASGGRGILLGGVPGAPAADVVIIGGGVSGANAATIALGMGAHVTILDRSIEVLRRLAAQFDGRVETIFSTRAAIAEFVRRADMVIGAVGQEKLLDWLERIDGLRVVNGCVAVDPETGMTSVPGLFAGGDCVNGGAEVVNAVAEGKLAAAGIDRFVRAQGRRG